MPAFRKDRYLSRERLEREHDRLWPRVWQLAGPVSDLPRAGTWFTFDIGRESILIVRNETGVRAFHNVCIHRGRALRDAGRGADTSLRCPYHHWEYALDGRLLGMPNASGFAGCLERESAGLAPVATETFAGFVWICLAPSPPSLAEYLGPLADRLASHALDEYALTMDQSVEVACNWKVGVDAFNEGYHVRAVHPELLKILDAAAITTEILGRHSVIHVPSRETPPIDNHQYFVFPNTTLSVRGNDLMLLRHRPHASDPERMMLDQQQLVRVASGAARPARPRTTGGSLGMVTDQDVVNMVSVQRGLRSSAFEGPILGADESLVMHMHRLLDEYVADV